MALILLSIGANTDDSDKTKSSRAQHRPGDINDENADGGRPQTWPAKSPKRVRRPKGRLRFLGRQQRCTTPSSAGLKGPTLRKASGNRMGRRSARAALKSLYGKCCQYVVVVRIRALWGLARSRDGRKLCLSLRNLESLQFGRIVLKKYSTRIYMNIRPMACRDVSD